MSTAASLYRRNADSGTVFRRRPSASRCPPVAVRCRGDWASDHPGRLAVGALPPGWKKPGSVRSLLGRLQRAEFSAAYLASCGDDCRRP